MLDGTVTDAGIALAAVGGDVRCREAEAELLGGPPSAERIEAAGRAASAGVNPVSDQRGSAEYKRHVAGVLTARALHRAALRATGAGECR